MNLVSIGNLHEHWECISTGSETDRQIETLSSSLTFFIVSSRVSFSRAHRRVRSFSPLGISPSFKRRFRCWNKQKGWAERREGEDLTSMLRNSLRIPAKPSMLLSLISWKIRSYSLINLKRLGWLSSVPNLKTPVSFRRTVRERWKPYSAVLRRINPCKAIHRCCTPWISSANPSRSLERRSFSCNNFWANVTTLCTTGWCLSISFSIN